MDIKMIKKIVVFCLVFMIISYPAAAEETRPVQITEADVARAIALKEREEAVQTREKELSSREQELAAVRKEVERKLARLVSLQSEVKGQLDELKSIQAKEFKNLIKIYSVMSATKLAPLLNKMDDAAVVRVLRAMKSDLVAKIMPKLKQEKAVEVSRRLGMMDK